jgi:hypothetical protein
VSRSGPDCEFSKCPDTKDDNNEDKSLTEIIKDHKENKSET